MLGDLVGWARSNLAEAPFGPSQREAYLLLGHTLGLSEAQLISRWDDPVPLDAELSFKQLLERRLQGEPVAYLLGRREFYGRSFQVDSRVLIPRPETEHLVEAALSLPLPPNPRILDLGTGSGCIAVTLALEIDRASVVAIDISPAALSVARANAIELGPKNLGGGVRFAAGDLAASVALEDFDLVVSNPPYIGLEEEDSLSPEILEFEPHRALFPPNDSTSIIQRLVAELGGLRPGAYLLFEIGYGQADSVRETLRDSAFDLNQMVEDYQDIPRVAVARRS